MSVDENKTCVLRHFDKLWNNRQVDRVEDFFAQDFMNFGKQYQDARPVVKTSLRSGGLRSRTCASPADFMVAEGDLVMCQASFQGTHLVEFPLLIPVFRGLTLAPNGKTFKVKHIHRFRLKEGKIIEHFAVRDDRGIFQQLNHLGVLSG